MGFFQIYEKGNDGLRVCLFEDEIGRMENFGEKIGGENEFVLRGERKLLCKVQAFSTQTHKNFSPKWRENKRENVKACCVTKMPSLFITLSYSSHFPMSCDISTLLPLHRYLSASSQQREVLQALFFLFLFFLPCLVFSVKGHCIIEKATG